MIRNVFKRIVPFLLALLVALSLPLSASAAEFDLGRTGTIQVQLRDVYFPEESIGGTLVLYKVGDASVVNSNLTFTLTGDFSGSGVSLSDISASGLAEKLAAYAAENNVPGQSAQAEKNGYVTFSGLSTGLYLVAQTEAVDGYYAVSPFLISLPMYSAENGWIYDIQAAPKVQRPPNEVDVTVRKVWLDNNKGRPEELVVYLLREGEFYAEAVLNAENQWQYTWEDLVGYYQWEVVEPKAPDGYTASYEVRGNTITITNRASWYVPPTDQLIQTGQLNWPVPLLACAGLSLLLIGCFLLRRRKQDS